jgi:hypothetical protein
MVVFFNGLSSDHEIVDYESCSGSDFDDCVDSVSNSSVDYDIDYEHPTKSLFNLIEFEKNARDGYGDAVPSLEQKICDLVRDDEADVNARNDREYTPLHEAACAGLPTVVEVLLELDAEIDLVTPDDETPLTLAVQHGHEDVVEVLLDNGALVTKKALNAANDKPCIKQMLDDAIKERQDAKKEVMQL